MLRRALWLLVALALVLLPAAASPDGLGGGRQLLFCPNVVAINQTASTQLVTGTANQFLYICTFVVISATAQSVSLVEGTGATCATAIAALLGGTTASAALAANGGLVITSVPPWLRTKTAADNLCLLQSGTGNVSGILTYVSRP